MRKASFAIFFCLSMTLAACNSSDPEDPDVLAVYGGGKVTREDIDQYMLQLTPQSRLRGDVGLREWYLQLLRRIAVDRLLYNEAVSTGADRDPEFQRILHGAQREYLSNRALREFVAVGAPVSVEAEMEIYYLDNLDQFVQPERRTTFHIFRRKNSEPNGETFLKGLRDRVLNGESFSVLADEHSHSESRHRSGALGNVTRGRFSQELEDIIFGLVEGTPSHVVNTSDGWHLFYVSHVQPSRSLSFEEALPVLRRKVQSSLLGKQLSKFADSLNKPEVYSVMNPVELQTALNAGQQTTPVLQIGAYTMDLGEFRQLVQEHSRQKNRVDNALSPPMLLKELAERELIFQHANSQTERAAGNAQPTAPNRQLLVEYYLDRKLRAWVINQPGLIQTHYENNQKRFSTPVMVSLSLAQYDAADATPEMIAGLENAVASLNDGETTLEQLASQYSGEVRSLGLVTLPRLRMADPSGAGFVAGLKPGQHSPPFTVGGTVRQLKLIERREPQSPPLHRVRQRVVDHYLENYSQDVYKVLVEDWLDAINYETVDQNISAAIGRTD